MSGITPTIHYQKQQMLGKLHQIVDTSSQCPQKRLEAHRRSTLAVKKISTCYRMLKKVKHFKRDERANIDKLSQELAEYCLDVIKPLPQNLKNIYAYNGITCYYNILQHWQNIRQLKELETQLIHSHIQFLDALLKKQRSLTV